MSTTSQLIWVAWDSSSPTNLFFSITIRWSVSICLKPPGRTRHIDTSTLPLLVSTTKLYRWTLRIQAYRKVIYSTIEPMMGGFAMMYICTHDHAWTTFILPTPSIHFTTDMAWPARPQDTYGLEKLYAEEMCLAYAKDFPIKTRIARYHNVYGPRGTWKGGREKVCSGDVCIYSIWWERYMCWMNIGFIDGWV